MELMNSNKNKLNSKKSLLFKPMPKISWRDLGDYIPFQTLMEISVQASH